MKVFLGVVKESLINIFSSFGPVGPRDKRMARGGGRTTTVFDIPLLFAQIKFYLRSYGKNIHNCFVER